MAKKGFGGMPGGMNMGNLMQQAQKMQRDMAEAQAEIAAHVVEATSGGGMVKVQMSGEHKLLDLEIQPEAVDADDVEMLQDLILAAIREAERQVSEFSESKMSKFGQMAGGLPGGLGF